MAKSPHKRIPQKLPYLAGITGGIGAGKSAVGAIIAARHPVLSSDRIAKDLLETDPGVRADIVHVFGAEVYLAGGKPNREWLASVVFSDPQKLEVLNSIIHPRTIKRMLKQAEELARNGAGIVFVESALLYEAKVDRHYNAIIAVVADEETIFQRLTQRGGFNREDVERRMANQLPQDEKAGRADFVIRNNGSLDELERSTLLVVRIIESMAKLHGSSRT